MKTIFYSQNAINDCPLFIKRILSGLRPTLRYIAESFVSTSPLERLSVGRRSNASAKCFPTSLSSCSSAYSTAG